MTNENNENDKKFMDENEKLMRPCHKIVRELIKCNSHFVE